MRLNLGSHNKIVGDDWVNVDILPLDNVDLIHDLIKFPYPWEDNSVDEILMVEVLEHISFRKTDEVLKECRRILKEGGKFHIQVPDIREMMFAYWNEQICTCIPHKPGKDYKGALLDCPNCKGYGKVHPNRWLYAFLGAQKHEYDYHCNIFTPERLEECLENAGFNKIDISGDKDGWKIIAKVIK
jgi:SAM-dependent methyltransferase